MYQQPLMLKWQLKFSRKIRGRKFGVFVISCSVFFIILYFRGAVFHWFWLSLAEVITKNSHSSFVISRTLKERNQMFLTKKKRKFFDYIGVKSAKIIHRGPPKKFKDIPLYLRVILNEKYFRAFYHSNLLGSLEVSPENHDMAPLNSSLTLNALKVYAD